MSIIISIITFFFPLFFFPLISDPVFMAKNFFLAVAVAVLLIFGGLILVKKEKLTYSIAPLDFFVILYLIANLASWFFMPRGVKSRSLIQPLGLGTIITLTIFYFIVSQTKIKNKIKTFLMPLAGSAVVLSIASILLFVLPETYSAPWVKYVNLLSFTSPLILTQFLFLVSILLVSQVIKMINKHGEIKQWWMAIITVVVLVGTGISLYRTIQGQPILLDWFSSWATSVEAFKRRPIFGVGPQNFNTAFSRFRPREFNQGDNWNIRFGLSHSWLLQVWAELGILGLTIFILLFIRSLKLVKKQVDLSYFLIAAWVVLFVFPGNMVALFLLYLGLALARGKGNKRAFKLAIGEKNKNAAPIIISGILIILSLLIGYFTYNLFLPEMTFYRAIQAASQNRAAETYDLQLKAINQNRFIQTYRTSFSQTNLALATNIIIQAQDQNKQLTEEESQQLQQLISQAVNEAKAAVSLEPQNVVGWENLALVYRQLVGVVEAADQWAISAYQQAIALDSVNPRLRIDYGGLLFGLGLYEDSARQFEVGVSLKPDYANAWYNWAHASKRQDKLQQAVGQLQQAASLVDRDSTDFEQVQAELDEWQRELEELEEPVIEEPEETEEITRPEPLPESQLDEPIVLPEDAAPPLEEGTTALEEGLEEDITPESTEAELEPSLSPEPTTTEQ